MRPACLSASPIDSTLSSPTSLTDGVAVNTRSKPSLMAAMSAASTPGSRRKPKASKNACSWGVRPGSAG